MTENMRIYEKVRNVPNEALKPIQGGRLKGMSDINPMWRLKMLTEVFGPCGIGWRIEITDKRLERGEGVEVVCFVDINLYVKVDGEWSAAIPGMGGSSFVTMEKHGPYTSDECFKMAYTDAISVACKSLGFAADVYFANDRTKYSDQGDGNTSSHSPGQARTQSQPSKPPYTPPQTQDKPQGNTGGEAMISDAQVKYVWRLKNEKNITDDDFKRIVAEMAEGKTSSKDLTKKEAHEIINFLNNYQVPVSAGAVQDDLPF